MSAQAQAPKKKDAPRKAGGGEESVVARARRMQRAEMRKVAAALGMEDVPPEEFHERLAAMKAERDSKLSDADRVKSTARELEEQNRALQKELARAKAELAKGVRELERTKAERDQLEVEFSIKDAAAKAGVIDTEFAMHLYRQKVSGTPETEEPPPALDFFESLKKDAKRRALFSPEAVAAGPSSVQETRQQAPAASAMQEPAVESSVPDQGAPRPDGAAPKSEAVDTEKMARHEFRDHARNKYGFSP